MFRLVLVLLLALVCGGAHAGDGGRAAYMRQRNANGTAVGHGQGGTEVPPYWQQAGYTLNHHGLIEYEYRYLSRAEYRGQPIQPEWFADIAERTNCAKTKEYLVEVSDDKLDYNGDHTLQFDEVADMIQCLDDKDRYLIHEFNIQPLDLVYKCQVPDPADPYNRSISASDFIMSEHCVPQCLFRQLIYLRLFEKIASGKCKIDHSIRPDPRDIFGDNWREFVGPTQEDFDRWGLVLRSDYGASS